MPQRIVKVYKKELKISNCGFNHDPAEVIVRSQVNLSKLFTGIMWNFGLNGLKNKNTLTFFLIFLQWQSRSKNNVYLVYRWLVAIFTTLVVIDSLLKVKSWRDFGIFCIYLTHWGIVMNMITGIMGAVLVTVWHFHSEYSGKVDFPSLLIKTTRKYFCVIYLIL